MLSCTDKFPRLAWKFVNIPNDGDQLIGVVLKNLRMDELFQRTFGTALFSADKERTGFGVQAFST